MNNKDLARYIDLTLLTPEAIPGDIAALCAQAKELGVYGVCVNPWLVEYAAAKLACTNIIPICVVGFPSGATFRQIKAMEAAGAIEDGAREIDMVMNLGLFKAASSDEVRREIAEVVDACDLVAENEGVEVGVPVKVIIETATLKEYEIDRACRLAEQAGAKYVKTSTGFHQKGGATVEAVTAMHRAVGGRLGIKASGGIRTREQALAMIAAGATRIGASDARAILAK